MLHKVAVGAEVMVLSVLENKDTAIGKKALFEDDVGYLGQFLKRVWRVGKNEIELLAARLDKTEHVAAYGHAPVGAEFLEALRDEGMVVAVSLNAHHPAAAARHEFERDAARARKKVESRLSVKVYISPKHIENVLFGKVGRGTRLERPRHVKVTALVFSCYYPHCSYFPLT